VRARADDIDDMKKFIARMDLSAGANVTDLSKRFDTKEYLSPHSDIVALMVLGHQTHVHNMITSGVYELRDAEEKGLSGKMSDLVYSKSFDAMPGGLKDYVYRRFREILSGQDTSSDFARLSETDRKAIFEILKETKADF